MATKKTSAPVIEQPVEKQEHEEPHVEQPPHVHFFQYDHNVINKNHLHFGDEFFSSDFADGIPAYLARHQYRLRPGGRPDFQTYHNGQTQNQYVIIATHEPHKFVFGVRDLSDYRRFKEDHYSDFVEILLDMFLPQVEPPPNNLFVQRNPLAARTVRL